MNGLKNFKLSFIIILTGFITLGSAKAANWDKIIKKNRNSVMTIRHYSSFSLNRENINIFFATGIIVDKKMGLVLVDGEAALVSPSVITGYLQNYEEVDLKTIYYDPIHNYAFLKFDPLKVKWNKLQEIGVGDSDSIRMGDEIVLFTTKKNKNLAVVHGNIVDIREPKRRNLYKYQDYNINYFDTSLVSIDEGGGIILNKEGKGIALHAYIHKPDPSDNDKDINFFAELPINFVRETLESLQNERLIKRGDLGVVLNFVTYSEALDLGVDKNILDKIKNIPNCRGLLYISSVINGTPNDQLFKTGDIIISVKGENIGDNYLKYEKILNKNVQEKINVTLFRNGEKNDIEVFVFDLLPNKTDKFVFFAGAIFHKIPWFIKARTNIGNDGVYVSDYYNGSPYDSSKIYVNKVIINLNGAQIKNIEEFYQAIKDLKDDELVRVRYIDLNSNNKESMGSFRVNKVFFPTRLFSKMGNDGDWRELSQPLVN